MRERVGGRERESHVFDLYHDYEVATFYIR